MKALLRAGALCCAALLAALQTAPAEADGDDTALTNLVALVSQRLALAEPVAHWKWVNRRPITDSVREQALLADVQKRAISAGVDPSFAHTFFADQIEANSAVQTALFETWRASQPPGGPPPDLSSVIRPQLDRLTPQLIAGLARVQAMRTAPDCPTRVARSISNWKSLTRYDSVRTDALTRALGHVCESGGVGGVA
ncbi:chorismate mutase [Paraburkholderia caballeronis]|uniref:chorismate mutase n=1 Tax=Paraburkholderia caballeronis TaxID=416943 RepID=UPI001066E6D5|nr:chorismate mutase [Paraburkholderia caballeronis]TDV23602.1 chorismate mutase [Paraburkholderia caballeronis]